MESIKQCKQCERYKDITQYHSNGKGGVCSKCKACKNIEVVKRRTEIRETCKPIIHEKECSDCKETLSITKFTKLATSKDGYNSFCKLCRRDKDSRRRDQKDVICEIFDKECHKCNVSKPCTMFKINRKTSDLFSHICMECTPKHTWNKDKQRESERKYLQNNPEKVRDKWKRQGQNINRRIRDALNHRIASSMKSNRTNKNNTTFNYLGCNLTFFKKWIEYMFYDEMSWQNYGTWHFDHVKPCCAFDLSKEEEQLQCFCWTNIRPLWSADNIAKGGKFTEFDIMTHNIKVREFISAQVKEGELTGTP